MRASLTSRTAPNGSGSAPAVIGAPTAWLVQSDARPGDHAGDLRLPQQPGHPQARLCRDVRGGWEFSSEVTMNDDASRWASFSSAFSIVLSLASNRIAELGCTPVGEDSKAFVDRGGLRRLEIEASEAAIRRVREAAYPLIFKLFGAEMPRGKERKLVLARLGQDMARIEKALGLWTAIHSERSARADARAHAW
jgi:hypothetical protein